MSEESKKYFEGLLAHCGVSLDAMGLDRRDCFSQYLVLRECGIAPPESVLDVGCGLGMGSPFFTDCDYTGIDEVGAMIDEARVIHAPDRFRHSALKEEEGEYDWVIASSLFSVGYKFNEVESAVKDLWARCKKGVALTFITVDVPGLRRFKMRMWVELAAEVTDSFVLRKDFLPHVAALYLYRPPR